MKKMLIVFVLLTIILSGCFSNTGTEPVTLKVVYDSQEEFMNKYGDMYRVKHPNIEFEVIPLSQYYKEGLSGEIYNTIVETQKPDLLYGFDLESYSTEGKLIDLEPFVTKEFSKSINQYILEYLRFKGSGRLYALSPTFAGKALFFNKTIFDQYAIPYPTDKMSWNELFALAKRLRAAEDIQHTTKSFSFYYAGTDLFSLAMEIASSQNVRYLNSDGTKITINTDNWKDIFDLIINGSRKGYIRTQSDISNLGNPYNDGGPFAKGQAAMTVDYSYLLNDLKHVNFKWDIVTIPVDPVKQGSISAIQPNAVFAISATSKKVEESWKFIEFIHSEQYARTLQKSGSYFVLPAREGLTTKFNDINLKAFYSVPPMDEPRYRLSFKKSNALYSLANDELREAITHTDLDTKILLTELETKMQLILKQK